MSKNTIRIITISAVLFAVSALLFYFSLFNSWQEKIFDRFFIKKSVPSSIVIFGIDNESIAKVGQWPWSRAVFAKVIGQLQSAKVIGIDVNFSEPSNTDATGDALLGLAIEHSMPPIILPVQVNQKTQEKVLPLPLFQKKGMLGNVGIINEDGAIRNVNNTQDSYASFGSLVALQYKNGLAVPGLMRIDYSGPEKTFLTFPISDLLQQRIPEKIYKDNIILIGSTAPDLHDFFQTPFGALPGVEIHANIIHTLLAQTFYRQVPFGASLLIILLCDILAGVCIVKIKRFSLLIFSLVAIFIGINLGALALFSFKIIIPILYFDVAFILTSATLITFQYIATSKEKRFIHNSFKYYLNPDVIAELIANPKKLNLGGERKKITVLFSDIRGFTTLSESMTPEQLTHILNEYLTKMTDVIMNQRGLVDKYIGDAVMAFWGAPLQNNHQAQDACMSAVKMIEELNNLNAHWKESNTAKPLAIGMGINTGEVVVGNFGSQKRFNYTVLGDEVNLAARLEGLNKTYGTSIIITEATKKEIENNPVFNLRELDVIIVKGKKEPKVIFELSVKPFDKVMLGHFNRGRKFYNEGKWLQALQEFSFGKDDGPSNMYFARCQEFQHNPPEHWNGVYEFKTK